MYVTSILIDKKNKIWVGTYNDGLNIYDPVRNKFTSYKYIPENKSGLNSNKITTIAQDSAGIIWIGTANQGLNKLIVDEKGNLRFLHYLASTLFGGTIPDNNIIKIFTDKEGDLWVITKGGFVSKYSYETDEFISYVINSKVNKTINILSLCEGDSGTIWMGTDGAGVLKFNKKLTPFIEDINPPGLKDRIVPGILMDEDNNLWLSTNYGLIKYNTYNNSITNYNLNDGLQSFKYTAGAYFKARNGEMFFGGINGFNCFNPDSMRPGQMKSKVVITSFKASNKEIPFYNKMVYLSSSENSFTITFSSQDFTDASKNEYLYTIEGADNEWKYTMGNNHSADYNDLPPVNTYSE